MDLLNLAFSIILFCYLIYMRNIGLISLGDIVFIISLSNKFAKNCSKTIIGCKDLKKDFTAFCSAFTIMQVPQCDIDKEDATEIKISKGEIEFKNLSFHYKDSKNIFENLGHSVDQWSLSGHRWLFNLPECKSSVINMHNWKNIDEKMVEDFFHAHKKDLDKYDAFICAYPPCFLKLFEKFNKPIIVIAATRYDHPFTDNYEKLKWLEDSLNNNNNLILVANNEFDKKYCEHFLTKKWQWIPSLCDYTKSKHNPVKKESVIFSKFLIDSDKNILHQSKLGQYTWQDLYSYKEIIHFPYNVSTMSIFEQHQAKVPLKFPSLDFSIDMLKNNIPIFSEITFPNNNPDRQSHLFLNKEWLSCSDFYNGVIDVEFFESFDFKTSNKNIKDMQNKDSIYKSWTDILNKL